MLQARDIMTGSVISCMPEMTVSKAARLMRDRKIGDVLVTDAGKLVGIVTDRDIAVRVTAKSLDPDQVAVHDVMSEHVQTGEPGWDLDKIARTMGKHQIRRLPITENGVPVGIVSLSDVALHDNHKSHVSKSLKEISESHGTHRVHSIERNLLRVTLGLSLLAAAAAAVSFLPKYGDRLWDQVQASRASDRLSDLVQAGCEKMSAALNSTRS